jgi:hypothetical protein
MFIFLLILLGEFGGAEVVSGPKGGIVSYCYGGDAG